MKIYRIERQEYHVFSLDGSIEFFVTFNENENCFIADVFDPTINDYGEAYVESFEFENLNEAIEDLKYYKLGMTLEDINKDINKK